MGRSDADASGGDDAGTAPHDKNATTNQASKRTKNLEPLWPLQKPIKSTQDETCDADESYDDVNMNTHITHSI